MEFKSVYEVMTARGEEVSIAELATSIELYEIGVWDDYGRFLKAEDEDKKELLAELAKWQERQYKDITENRIDPEDLGYPWEDMTYALNRFGWTTETLPKFAEVYQEWAKEHSFGGLTAPKKLRPNSAEYRLIDALTILAFDKETLDTLQKSRVNGINKLYGALPKGYTVSTKSLTRIYRGGI